MRSALIAMMCLWAGQLSAQELDTTAFRQWGEEEWKSLVLEDPRWGRDFARAKFQILSLEDRDVVHVAYALGIAEYLLGRHMISNGWYTYALEHSALVGRQGAHWSDETTALRKEAALLNNIGVNFEIMGDFVSAEAAYARCRKIDLLLGDEHAAWMTVLNIGFLRYCEHQYEDAQHILQEAVAFFRETEDRYHEGLALLNLALTEHRIAPGTDALETARAALALFTAVGDSTEAMRTLVTCGRFLDAADDHAGLRQVLTDLDAFRPVALEPLIRYEELVLRARLAAHEGQSSAFDAFVDQIEQMATQYPDLMGTDEELEVLMTAAHARGGLPELFKVFRTHSEALRKQYSARSSAVLAEAWELNDREAQVHQMEQLELRLSFAQRLNTISGFALLLALLAAGLFVWKRRTDMRNQAVIVRLLRQRRKPEPADPAEPSPANDSPRGHEHLFASLEALLDDEPLHRNASLSLGELASRLSSNMKYLAAAIRQSTSMSFVEYLNMLRAHDAQKMMLSKEHEGLSFDQIAEQCGFGSRRTFYRQFTHFTGMPPGQFLKLSEEDRAAHLMRSQD